MPSLYQLNRQVSELIEELDALDTETAPTDIVQLKPDEIIADIESTLTELFQAIEEKRSAYVHVIKNAVTDAKVMRAEAKRLVERAKRQERLAEQLKTTLMLDLTESGEIAAEAGIHRIRIAKSPQRVELDVAPELLPKAYQRISVSPNTNAIRQAIKDGQIVEGAKLTQGTHLRIT